MSDRTNAQKRTHRIEAHDGRRRQLRALILTAANAARRSRRLDRNGPAARHGRPIRDRVLMLLSAAS